MKNVTYINASAGSGKTYTLTHQLAELIKENKVRPDQIIMTTFTVKAANEMKEEAKKVLYEEGLFTQATQLDQAMIGTIHSVANSLIRKYWFFLGLSPDMGVMAEEDTKFYISQSLSELPTQEELKQLHSFCESVGMQYSYMSGKSGLNYDFWKDDIEKVIAFTTNYEIESYDLSIKESLDFIRQFVQPGVTLDYSPSELKAVLSEHQSFLEGQAENDANKKRLNELHYLWRGVNNPSIGWYKRLGKLLNALKKCGPKAGKIREELTGLWHSQFVYDEQERYIRILFRMAQRWRERFRLFKKERNLLDYNDMEKYLHDLLSDEELGKEIAMGYRYLFVDEYQDCSPIQVKIFDRLSELMEHSYWVGDYKQAIYGFRGSDITLTKAVIDRISTGQNGCEMAKPLDTSYRSLPDIVDVCNETFKHTFANVLDEKSIILKKHRTNDGNIQSLRYWDFTGQEYAGIIDHVADLVQQGVRPSDIAILGRTNDTLNNLAYMLTDTYGIPAYSKEGLRLSEMKATPLVLALLALVLSEKDSLAKAQIAILTEEGYDTRKIIEEKLLLDADELKKESDYLNGVPLVERLLSLRPMLEQQSVSALVETMIIELDLYNEIKKIGRVDESTTCLNTVIQAGYAYEQHCLQMNLPATVNGFMEYLNITDPAGKGDANGVQLLTYHGSKGLQWKYVILTQLNEKKIDPKKCVRQNIYGIHFNYAEQPSAATPYPEVYISALPFIYGSGNTNVPADIQNQIEQTPLFEAVSKDFLSEENRLLYVGMTRPRDVLILTLQPHAKTVHALQWLTDVGLESVNLSSSHDILGVGSRFEDDTMTMADSEAISSYRYSADDEKMKTRRIPYQDNPCEEEQKFISPSTLHEKGDVTEHYVISDRLPQGTLVGKTMADVGNCIHQIFCGIEEHIESDAYYTDLIESYGLKTFLVDHKAIRNAWEKLVLWLTEQYGQAVNVYHERPFTLTREGQVFTGSIDLVWQTAEGDVLIDFKTCPLGQKYILDSDSEHYAGWYAGQLDAYTEALEAAGEKVIKRYIYYPVSGTLCEIGQSFKAPKMVMYSNVYCFDASDSFDLNKMVESSAKELDETILCGEMDPDEEEIQRTILYINGQSTQGVNTILMKTGMYTIHLPYLASRSDVALAFTLMREAMKLRPGMKIYDSDEKTIADLSEENELDTYYYRLDNMANIIENQDEHIGVKGLVHEFHIFPEYIKAKMPDAEPKDWTYKAFEDFIDIQWNYGDYENFNHATVGSPDGEGFVARILANNKGFAAVCQKVILYDGKEPKIVPIEDFFEATKDNKYIKRLDYSQFVIDTMPENEWKEFYDSFDVDPIRPPKTYLLRWNPAISSFKHDDYRDVLSKYPDGFSGMNWSVYEWEEAHKGDNFYMLRTGDNMAGIVFRGVFTSEPYSDDDWAGKGKQRYYMDMDCYDCMPAAQKPLVSLEELEKALPDIDWRRGHSGQLLSKEDANRLDELWNRLMKSE